MAARVHDSLYCLKLGVAVAAIFVACGGYVRAAVERGHAKLRAEAMGVLTALVRRRRHLRLGDARATMKLDGYRDGLE